MLSFSQALANRVSACPHQCHHPLAHVGVLEAGIQTSLVHLTQLFVAMKKIVLLHIPTVRLNMPIWSSSYQLQVIKNLFEYLCSAQW